MKRFFKRNILSVAAALIAITVMSFTLASNSDTEAKLVDYKWFKIQPGYSLTDPVLQAEATYLGTGPTAPGDGDCGSSGMHQCISGFNASQVNGSNQLKDDNQIPAQTPQKRP